MADKKRRMSLRNVFKRPETPPAASSVPSGPPSPILEKRFDQYAASPDDSDTSSPRIRPRTLQKSSRTSMFGSLRSLQSLDEDERAVLTRSDSKASSMNDEYLVHVNGGLGEHVVQHGEVQVAGSTMFRKKTFYLVLTESHLVRFKNLGKAVDIFPSLASFASRPSMPRHSTSSLGSLSDLQMTTSGDFTQAIPLDQIVGVYTSDDARSTPLTEILWLDERSSRSSAIQVQFTDPHETQGWADAIRQNVLTTVSSNSHQLRPATLAYMTRVLEMLHDYDPLHFRAFKVVQLTSLKPVSRSSVDDSSKTHASICLLAIGRNKIHFIQPPTGSKRSSSTSVAEYEAPVSLGIANLASLKLYSDDVFDLCFKHPAGIVNNVSLASFHANDIALWIRFASEYIRPEWTIQPFIFDVPTDLDDRMDPPDFPAEEHNSFDRTLFAYCAALDVNASRIRYIVDYYCEDSPCFKLLSPTHEAIYTVMELLAVLRALRYNEIFTSISFADVDLRPLRDFHQVLDSDIDWQSTRSGAAVSFSGQSSLSLLSKEIRALALKSRRLRRFDFTNALSSSLHAGDAPKESGIPLALAPLMKKSLTNVDWIILNGIQLAESDLDHLVDAASERLCHIRALEVGDCGISVHDVDVLLSTLAVHEHTLEVINVSAAQGRLSPEIFQRAVGNFAHIRKLNLSRCQKTAGPESLLASETLLGWRLESLTLSQAMLNEQMIFAVCEYLRSPMSDTLRELHVNQCGLTGRNLAAMLEAMTRTRGIARNLHVNASENRLGVESSALAKCIAEDYGPVSLSVRMIDFEKEHHFRELIDAISVNTTLRTLDLSRASLPYDASEETCQALKDLFSSNKTLEDLDISGEHAHLDAARFGIGLNIALLGLANNHVLRSLRIEHQGLGLQGASTLAGVLETNRSLLEIHCEHNDINLQSYTVLANALRKNETLLFMPDLAADRAKSIEKIREEFNHADRVEENGRTSPTPNAILKGISALSHKTITKQPQSRHRKNSSLSSNISFTEKDITAAIASLEERWQAQAARVQHYLIRNYNIAAGTSQPSEVSPPRLHLSDLDVGNDGRPATADSLGKILAKVKLDRTPTVERPGLLDTWDLEKKFSQVEGGSSKRDVIFRLPEEE